MHIKPHKDHTPEHKQALDSWIWIILHSLFYSISLSTFYHLKVNALFDTVLAVRWSENCVPNAGAGAAAVGYRHPYSQAGTVYTVTQRKCNAPVTINVGWSSRFFKLICSNIFVVLASQGRAFNRAEWGVRIHLFHLDAIVPHAQRTCTVEYKRGKYA